MSRGPTLRKRSWARGWVRRGTVAAAITALALTVQGGPTVAASPHPDAPVHRPVAPTSLFGTTVTKAFFGMHSSTLMSFFPAAPVGSVGLMTDGVYWPDLETSPGSFDFTRLESLVQQAETHGARPLLILGQTPSFHAAEGTTYSGLASVPDMSAWKSYVRAVVTEFGNRLDYEVWPEPNVKPNWVGTPHQMADLVVAAARIIHRTAPGAVVVAPGMVLRLHFELVFMQKFFAQKVNGVPVGRVIDAVGVDPYPLEDGGPEESLALIQEAQRILHLDGVQAPIWTLEVNYGAHVGSVGTAEHSSWSQQASWVARTYLLSAGAGLGRVFWLGWGRYQNLDIQMVDTDLSTPTPAAQAYALVAQWLIGQHPRGCFYAVDRGVYSCTFVRGGHTSWAYWTTSGRSHVRAPDGAWNVEKVTGELSATHPGGRIPVRSVPVWVTD